MHRSTKVIASVVFVSAGFLLGLVGGLSYRHGVTMTVTQPRCTGAISASGSVTVVHGKHVGPKPKAHLVRLPKGCAP